MKINLDKESLSAISKGMLAFHFALIFTVVQATVDQKSYTFIVFMLSSAICISSYVSLFLSELKEDNEQPKSSGGWYGFGLIASLVSISTFFGVFIGVFAIPIPFILIAYFFYE